MLSHLVNPSHTFVLCKIPEAQHIIGCADCVGEIVGSLESSNEKDPSDALPGSQLLGITTRIRINLNCCTNPRQNQRPEKLKI